MAATVNSVSNSDGMPSAAKRTVEVNLDFDNSYVTGGEDVTAGLPDGTKIIWSPRQSISDGTTAILAQLVTVAGVTTVLAFTEATGVEIANATDLSAYTGVVVGGIAE